MKAQRRFTEHTPPGSPSVLPLGHNAAIYSTTRYPATVRPPTMDTRVLKSGANNRKIGSHVVKGPWRGMPIYTLTLEERATCPRSCAHWLDCYGNKMHWSHRFEHGPALIIALDSELADLNMKHPDGFVVRLHILGDFYSVDYVRQWERWLRYLPSLHVFGYTARPPYSEIGERLNTMSVEMWGRFAIRFSNSKMPERATASARKIEDALPIVCPAQTGASECCGTCGLCWGTKKNITFLVH